MEFVRAVKAMQEFMADHLDGNPYPLAEERQHEAQLVAPCAGRFVDGEMDPTEQRTVARGKRFGPLGAPPSLAKKLGNKLADADTGTADSVQFAIHKLLASGYLSVTEGEERAGIAFHPERSAEEVWEFWMATCRIMLEDDGIPKSWAQRVRQTGADLLVADLKDRKLTRFLGGSKIGQLGLMYAQAGVHLRMAQTDNTTDSRFADGIRWYRELPDQSPKLQV